MGSDSEVDFQEMAPLRIKTQAELIVELGVLSLGLHLIIEYSLKHLDV